MIDRSTDPPASLRLLLHPSPPPHPYVQALQRIAEAHAATVVGKDEEGGSSSKDAPTHIVHWDPEGMDKGLPRALLRRWVCGFVGCGIWWNVGTGAVVGWGFGWVSSWVAL